MTIQIAFFTIVVIIGLARISNLLEAIRDEAREDRKKI